MNKGSPRRIVALVKIDGDIMRSIATAMEQSGILARIGKNTRVAIKPNLTYPYYKPGVTTSPAVMEAVVQILSERTSRLAIVETDGGYGAWSAVEAFEGHGVYTLRERFGCQVVNLCEEQSEPITFAARGGTRQVLLPKRLLHETDLLITMPVPKIHCMTGLTLSYKNQWGCVPDIMRLRRHYIFDEAIIAINQRLRPAVLGDGTYFLDKNGPMKGVPVKMNMIIAASDAGSFDRYVSELMGFSWRRVGHLRLAAACGDMPVHLREIMCSVPPNLPGRHVFRLRRTIRNWIALTGFRSRFLTWLGYESWFGRVVLHAVLYAIAGKPIASVKPNDERDLR
jgi:uncharacterized protein (DUF362 family)